MRLATLLFAFLTLSASADFFIGDTGVAPEPPRVPSGRILAASDGKIFYIIGKEGMNRVDSNGVILDREPFGVHDMLDPVSVAYGRGLLVIMHRQTNSLNANATWATAMTTAGNVLWTTFIANSAAWVVYDGREFVVVYGDEPEIKATTLDETGFPAAPVVIATYFEGVRPSAPRAVSTAGGLLAVWRETGSMRAVPFDRNGPRGEVVTVGTGSLSGFGSEWNRSFAVASSGTGAMVAWINRTTEEPQRSLISAQRVDTAGRPAGDLIEVPVPERTFDPDVAWDGARYHVAWIATSSDFLENRLAVTSLAAPGGVGISTAMIEGSTGMLSPVLAVASDNLLVAWKDFRAGGVRGRTLSPGQTWDMTAERILRTVPFHATAPAVVWTGELYVVTWLRSGAIAFRRFTRDGVALDAEARVLVPFVRQPNVVRMATTGSETAIVWTDQEQVFVTRIDADGASVDPEPILVATGANPDSADVASDGRRFMIVWAGEDAVHARRLSSGGGFVDAAPIFLAVAGESSTRIAFDGSRFVVGFVTNGSLHATSLSPFGAVGASVLLAENVGTELSVSSNGSTHLFTSGRTFVLTGADLTNARVIEGPYYVSHPDAIWTGTRFLVAGNGVVGWVSADGDLAPSTFPFVHNDRANALATTGDGTVLHVYSELTRSFRAALFGRLLAPRRRAAAHPE